MYVTNFLNLINYQITGGSEYLWKSFGENARFIDSDEEVECVFDSKTQLIYQIIFNVENLVYRWTDPRYVEAFKKEQKERLGDNFESELAHIEVEDLDEIIAMIKGVKNNKDTVVELNLDDDVLNHLMRVANERDITLSQLVNELLRDFIKENSLESI